MNEPTDTGDYTTVAKLATATEAHVIQGALRAAGLEAHVPDANLTQAYSLITVALGGVRVVVPSGQVADAHEVLKALDRGELGLDDGEGAMPPPALPVLATPVFSPDKALLLSGLLTPVFAVAVQIANAHHLGHRRGMVSRWLALVALAAISGMVILTAHGMSPGPFVVFRASPVMLAPGLIWYFFLGGHAQSRALIDTHGPRYPRRSLLPPSLIAAAICLAIGWALDRFLF